MVGWRQWRALATSRNVCISEPRHHVNSGIRGKPRAVAYLPSEPVRGIVGQCMTVKPDELDRLSGDRKFSQQIGDRARMVLGQCALNGQYLV